MKNTTEMPGNGIPSAWNMVIPFGRRGSTTETLGEAYSIPIDLLAGGKGSGCPLPENPTAAPEPRFVDLGCRNFTNRTLLMKQHITANIYLLAYKLKANYPYTHLETQHCEYNCTLWTDNIRTHMIYKKYTN